jgi:hypothetical protein
MLHEVNKIAAVAAPTTTTTTTTRRSNGFGIGGLLATIRNFFARCRRRV